MSTLTLRLDEQLERDLNLLAESEQRSKSDARAIADADDVPILAAALALEADCFVTGDKLALGKAAGMSIASPRRLFEALTTGPAA